MSQWKSTYWLVTMLWHIALQRLVSTSSTEPHSNLSSQTHDSATGKPKVRVNVLYLSLAINAPMLERKTFETHLQNFASSKTERVSQNSSVKFSDVYPGSVPWMDNDQLSNVEVYVSLRDTKYDVNYNLQLTLSTLLDLLVTKSAASCDQNDTNSTGPVIHIIVGPGFSSEVEAISQLTSFYQLVIIGAATSSPALSDRSRYPYFFRTCPSDGDGPDVVANVLGYFGYNQVNVFYQDEAYIMDFREMLEPNMRARGIRLENSFVYDLHDNRTYVHMADILGYTAKSRIWVLPISTNMYELFCALYKFGHISGKTHFVLMYGEASDSYWFASLPPVGGHLKKEGLYVDECTPEQIREVVRGAVQVAPGDADFEDRRADVGLRPSEFQRDMEAAFVKSGQPADTFYSYMYFMVDALEAAALALDRTEHELQENYNTSLAYFHYNDSRVVQNIFGQLSNLSFQGLTGPVSFSRTGDRANSGWILRQFQDANFVDVGRYEAKNATSYNITLHQKLVFPTDDGKLPLQFTLVEPWANTLNVTLVVIAATLAALLLCGAYIYVRRRLKESALRTVLGNAHHWLIKQSALVVEDFSSTPQSMMFTASNFSLSSKASKTLSRVSGTSKRSATSGTGKRRERRASLPFLSYKYEGSHVCLFPLLGRGRRGSVSSATTAVFDREFAGHLLRIQSCSHDNLLRFVGVVQLLLSESNLMYAVMADSPKGTLSEFLADASDEVELDETCSFSFVRDLQKGLTEVHKQLGYHGRLSSSICMVDNRLSLRISDYGFCPYRQNSFFSPVDARYEKWLWSAPEVLSVLPKGNVGRRRQTLTANIENLTIDWIKCDMYSFGIIIAEVFSQCSPPFKEQMEAKTAQQLVECIPSKTDMVQNIWCEQLNSRKLANDVVDLSLFCMAFDPARRPTLPDVGLALRSMMKSRKLSDNLTEMLMCRLETYATDLESLVQQRTAALVEEENKVRRLLYQILPPSVADALKNGESVPPQTYESVSIYFSDIVGFTTISAQSTPLEVVDLLNDLYNTFDLIISKFDVYKVETIGDSYMVVSGLPTPNGLEHARNVVRMSLALIDHVTSVFKIRHRPNEQLLLRIGIHTGPCAAGVVGFVMPRYCLFGDTVNTASRMESNGEPLRIHASEVMAQTLRDLEAEPTGGEGAPEFVLDSRGNIEIKGKGTMHTYWVSKQTLVNKT